MKKFLLLLLLILPLNLNAQEYKIGDFSIELDDKTWYVFTRDNLVGNPHYEELNITYEYMVGMMNEYNLQIDAIKLGEETENFLEIVVAKKAVEDNKVNLHVLSNAELKLFGKEYLKVTGANSYEIYEVNGYKYFTASYTNATYNIVQYFTVINGYGYTFMAQKIRDFSILEENEFKKILNTVKFELDPKYEERPKDDNSNYTPISVPFLILVFIIADKVKKKNESKKEEKKVLNEQLPINKEVEIVEATESFTCSACGFTISKNLDMCPKCYKKN